MSRSEQTRAPRGGTVGRAESDLIIPLRAVVPTELVFTHGVVLASIQGERDLPERLRGRFEGPPPQVEASDQQVVIHYPRLSLVDWARYALLWGREASVVRLSAAAPWAIVVRGGVSKLTADLRALELRGLAIQGGASELRVDLPPPRGAVVLRIGGGARAVTIRRPQGSAARLVVQGSAQQLTFDAQHFGAIGGAVRLESAGPRDAADRYEIEVEGGASGLIIDTW
jgi:hypothetical protein